METLKKEVISLSEVKDILEKIGIEEMDQIQRWTYDYVSKFAKSPSDVSRKIINELVASCDLKEDEAVEIANAMPNSIEELRAFTFGWKKLILTDTLNKILDIIDKVKYGTDTVLSDLTKNVSKLLIDNKFYQDIDVKDDLFKIYKDLKEKVYSLNPTLKKLYTLLYSNQKKFSE